MNNTAQNYLQIKSRKQTTKPFSNPEASQNRLTRTIFLDFLMLESTTSINPRGNSVVFLNWRMTSANRLRFFYAITNDAARCNQQALCLLGQHSAFRMNAKHSLVIHTFRIIIILPHFRHCCR